MIALLLIGSAVATALVLAAAARFRSLVSTLLAAYLTYTGNLGITTLALSPFHWVTRTGLGITEGVLLVGALSVWWLRGRPGLPLAGARSATGVVLSDPVTALFLVAVLILLAYELVVGLTAPPNNNDSLYYHLTRAAAWAEHGGLYWIPNSPNVELNAYQPLAEQQILFLFVATHSGLLFAMPQFLGELAILVAVYGASRRLGFEARAAACSALLLATFSTLALESTTGQNDLVTGAFIAVAACLLLDVGRLAPALGGASAAFALGTKLTAGLALPTLFVLAIARGRRTFAWALAGGVVGFVAIGMWGYVRNDIHTGHILGSNTGGEQDRGSPGYPRSVANAFYLAYELMDLSILSNRLIRALAIVGAALAIAGVVVWRRYGMRRAVMRAFRVALPFVAGMLVIGGGGLVAWVAYVWGFPIRGPLGVLAPYDPILNERITHISQEDYSAFGPVGIVALLAAIAITVVAFIRRRADARHAVLAGALPLFLVLIALESSWVPFLVRFFVIPAALGAPLLAYLFRSRVETAAWAIAACIAIGMTVAYDQSKQLESRYGFGRPWQLTTFDALVTDSRYDYATAVTDYAAAVPRDACVGAVLSAYEPSYELYGYHFEHRVVYLSEGDPVTDAIRHGIFYVVVGNGPDQSVVARLQGAGWKIAPGKGPWLFAVAPHASAGGGCTT